MTSMQRLAKIAMAVAVMLAAGGAAPEAPPAGIAWRVLTDINEYYEDIDDPTNRPALVTEVPADVIRPVDISHDGKTDWLVDYAKAGINGVCGTGGCSQKLYVSTDEGYFVRAFDQQAFELTVSTVAGETRVEAWVHDLFCGRDRDECRFVWAWDDKLHRLVERPSRDGVTLLTGGGFVPVDAKNDDAPAAIADWARSERHVCLVDFGDGYDVRQAVLAETADLNGDGKRDWLAFPSTSCDTNEDKPGFLVWTSNATDDTFAQTYSSGIGSSVQIEIKTKPATVLENPACEGPAQCPTVTLSWDTAKAEFKRP
jgi:hypothetical protein